MAARSTFSFSSLIQNRVPLPVIFHPSLSFANNIFSVPVASPLPFPTNKIRILENQIHSTGGTFRSPSRRKFLDRCYRCGSRGHFARSCNMRIVCFNYVKYGHKSFRCFKKRSFSSRSPPGLDEPCSLVDFVDSIQEDLTDKILFDPDVINCGGGFVQPIRSDPREGFKLRPSSVVKVSDDAGKGLFFFRSGTECGSFSFIRVLEWENGVRSPLRSVRDLKLIRRRSQNMFLGLKAIPPRKAILAHSIQSPVSSVPMLEGSKHVSLDDGFPAVVVEACFSDTERFPASCDMPDVQMDICLDSSCLDDIRGLEFIDGFDNDSSRDVCPRGSSSSVKVAVSRPVPVRRSPKLNKVVFS